MKRTLVATIGLAIILAVGGIAYYILADTNGDEGYPQLPSGEGVRQYNWSTMDQGPYNDRVSYATSSDLLHWEDSKKTLAEHASVPDAIYNPTDGTIYLYFVDVTQDGKPEQIGILRSKDKGKSWLPKTFAAIEGVGDKVPVDPDPFILPDGRIRLYYFDIEGGSAGRSCKIYSAISEDGINFTQEAGVRFERDICAVDPDIVKIDDTYRMYLGGTEGKIILATSNDGLNFTEEGAVFDGGVPNVFHDGKRYILYTAGIHTAFSKDGKSFTKQSYSFQSKLSPLTADPGVIQVEKNRYVMFYKTNISQALKP